MTSGQRSRPSDAAPSSAPQQSSVETENTSRRSVPRRAIPSSSPQLFERIDPDVGVREQDQPNQEQGKNHICRSDSDVRIDPLEELRELEGIARRRTLRRDVLFVETPLCCGADEGAASLGLERWPDVKVDLGHPSLAGIEPEHGHAALVFGCGADVFV